MNHARKNGESDKTTTTDNTRKTKTIAIIFCRRSFLVVHCFFVLRKARVLWGETDKTEGKADQDDDKTKSTITAPNTSSE